MHMRKQTRACDRKRVSERMHVHIWTRIFIDQPYIAWIFTFRLHAQPAVRTCIKMYASLDMLLRVLVAHEREGDAREKEVA